MASINAIPMACQVLPAYARYEARELLGEHLPAALCCPGLRPRVGRILRQADVEDRLDLAMDQMLELLWLHLRGSSRSS